MTRSRWAILAVLLAVLAACGPDAKPKPIVPIVQTPPDPPAAERVTLTLVSASIDTRRAGDLAWDDVKHRPRPGTAPGVAGPLALYAGQHPELDGSLALVDDADADVSRRAAETAEADPAVLIQIGDQVYRSPVRPGQLEPVWDFPIEVDLAPTDLVHVTVIDWDDWASYDVIGDKVVAASELLAGPVLALPRIGMVAALTLTARPTLAQEGRYRVAVSGRPSWSETSVNLVAGQEVTIIAAGEICSKGDDRSKCAGPEGQLEPAESNLAGFERVGHAALLARIGDTRFVVGRERRFIAPSSGPLVLGINDRDAGNNRGELEVSVKVR